MSINDLSSVDALSSADQVPLYSAALGENAKSSLSLLLSFIQENITASDDFVSQYSAPSATGFSVTINSPIDNVAVDIWLILTPTGGFAAGTIVLPPVASCVDHQEVMVSCTQSVTTLTVSGNGATVNGAPATLSANGFFKLKFNAINSSWYRIG